MRLDIENPLRLMNKSEGLRGGGLCFGGFLGTSCPAISFLALEAGEWASWPCGVLSRPRRFAWVCLCLWPPRCTNSCRKDVSLVCHSSASQWSQKHQILIIQTEAGAVFIFALSLLSCPQLLSPEVVEKATRWGQLENCWSSLVA